MLSKLKKLQVPDLSQVYGVFGDCAFDKLEYFNVINCVPPDLMHDVLEGVIPLLLKLILRNMVKKHILTFNQINFEIKNFKHGSSSKGDKPSALSRKYLSAKCIISGDATEKPLLVSTFPFHDCKLY